MGKTLDQQAVERAPPGLIPYLIFELEQVFIQMAAEPIPGLVGILFLELPGQFPDSLEGRRLVRSRHLGGKPLDKPVEHRAHDPVAHLGARCAGIQSIFSH